MVTFDRWTALCLYEATKLQKYKTQLRKKGMLGEIFLFQYQVTMLLSVVIKTL